MDHFRGIYKIYLKWIKQNRKMSTCNRLDLESLGSWPTIYAQKLPGHYFRESPMPQVNTNHLIVLELACFASCFKTKGRKVKENKLEEDITWEVGPSNTSYCHVDLMCSLFLIGHAHLELPSWFICTLAFGHLISFFQWKKKWTPKIFLRERAGK